MEAHKSILRHGITIIVVLIVLKIFGVKDVNVMFNGVNGNCLEYIGIAWFVSALFFGGLFGATYLVSNFIYGLALLIVASIGNGLLLVLFVAGSIYGYFRIENDVETLISRSFNKTFGE